MAQIEIYGLKSNVDASVGITAQPVEITIFETPKENWGFRGVPGDEMTLAYKIEV